MRQFKRRDINNAFREMRNQEESRSHDKKVVRNVPSMNRGFDKIAKPQVVKLVEDYKPLDILIAFKNIMKDEDIKFYSTTKLDQRYLRNIKMLQERHSNQEIIDMLEFLIKSEQTYLDKVTIHPGILLTQWVSRIKADTEAYKKGEYTNEPPKKQYNNTREFIKGREYSGQMPTTGEGGSVGEWK